MARKLATGDAKLSAFEAVSVPAYYSPGGPRQVDAPIEDMVKDTRRRLAPATASSRTAYGNQAEQAVIQRVAGTC